LLAFGPCSLEDRVYRERSSTEPPFFFMYSCLFADLHVSLPFDAFTAGVLRELNVAPTQLHPNSWASIHAFRICVRRSGCVLFPPASFIFTRLIRPSLLVGSLWSVGRVACYLSPSRPLIRISKRSSLKCTWSRLGHITFFDEVGQPRFPLFWSRNPTKITDWPRPAYPSEHERMIFSLFDSLPKKLPARPLMLLYNATDRAEAFEGMLF